MSTFQMILAVWIFVALSIGALIIWGWYPGLVSNWWRKRQNPPRVEITRYGQQTPHPQVTVSIVSSTGAQTVYAYNCNTAGEAAATLHGKSVAHILQIPLVDLRACGDFHADMDLPDWCICGRHKSEHLPEARL